MKNINFHLKLLLICPVSKAAFKFPVDLSSLQLHNTASNKQRK